MSNNTILVIILIIAYALLACIKVFAHSYYSKRNISVFADTIVFWLYTFLIIGLIFLPLAIINKEFKSEIIIYGLLCGIFTTGFQLFYTLALKEGPLSLSVFFTSICNVINVIYSIIVFKEPFSVCKGIAIALFIGALAFNIKKDKKKSVSLKWGVLILIACLFSIGINIVNKHFAIDYSGNYKSSYLSLTYLFSFAITAIVLIPFLFKQKIKPLIKIDKNYFIFGTIIAVILFGCSFINQWTTSIADMTFFIPFRGAIVMILSILEGWIIYKERPTILQWIGIACGFGASLLINF